MVSTFRSARERVRPRTMLRTCAEPGCDTFVLGGFCLEHEVPQTQIFVRGRPFVPRVMMTSPKSLRRRAPLGAPRVFSGASAPVLVGAGRTAVAE